MEHERTIIRNRYYWYYWLCVVGLRHDDLVFSDCENPRMVLKAKSHCDGADPRPLITCLDDCKDECLKDPRCTSVDFKSVEPS